MIIKKLVLHNFRVFHGTHEIHLTPQNNSQHQKPIVLIGGLNGAGKTSILTAIRFALHGRLAFDGIHQTRDYLAHISALINHRADGTSSPAEANVELTFTYNKDGEESEFTVVRSWKRDAADRLALQQNGVPLKELNYEQCQGFLNELIPPGIADLFFFDGEKISALAEDSSGQLLKTAVKRLLGLDVIERLITDLSIFIKRQNSLQLEETEQLKLSELEAECDRLRLSIEQFRFSADLAKNRLDFIAGDIRKLEGTLAAQGGAFALSKNQEQLVIEELLKEKAVLERNLRHECEGSLAYGLAPKTMRTLLRQLDGESESKSVTNFSEQLGLFLEKFKEGLKSSPEKIQTTIKEMMESQLNNYFSSKPSTEILLDISDRETGIINHAITHEAKQSWDRFHIAKDRLAEIERALEDGARNIERAPDDQQLLNLFTKIRDLDKKRATAYDEYEHLLKNIKLTIVKQLDCERKIRKLHDSVRSNHGTTTAVSNASVTISMLKDYAEALTAARVKKLEKNFSDAYSRLARKDDLKITARISPDTFDVELIDQQKNVLNRKALSAGEKQIYAVAVLDALAKTSGRQLPVIIDTPLGRLDSVHRQNLVDNYFPFASHQVILLSTDTEVGETYFSKHLSSYVSHSYQIEFDSNNLSTRILPGYFWSYAGGLN
ncbi:DNA sulfur modification protein DndD [Pseudomonas sp. GV047]|uniref:DNA sulfur modification protein DndD n=1 Tax=Pseudomonas sp. GV047 TaxID=2135751 RepID=UPI000D3CA571|nr:DNA sulfur modification protein DndD [Pseudomonas sp. GV047]PUB42699.1 DNA sulfur modification protein DndD [Pseudomonas sp. GV047]